MTFACTTCGEPAMAVKPGRDPLRIAPGGFIIEKASRMNAGAGSIGSSGLVAPLRCQHMPDPCTITDVFAALNAACREPKF